MLAPLVFNTFSTTVLRVAEKRFLADAAITDNTVQLQRNKEKREMKGAPRTRKVDGRRGKEGDEVQRLWGMMYAEEGTEEEAQRVWGMTYADDAGIVSYSSEGLERMMTVIVTACSAFGLTVSGSNGDNVPANQRRGEGVLHNQCRRPGIQSNDRVCKLGRGHKCEESPQHVTRRLQRAWACFQRNKMEIYDRPGVRLRLKVRLLKAEIIETPLYGRMTWSPNKPDYDRLPRVHHSMLLRCLGWRKRKQDDHPLS